ncbi:hypothetical protein LTR05_005929 [Lithohypha guttulata]|uniref:Uncharacterized protein n=1 Tax=Lithohypha guttulata TaxID=1690604 RepID=A0AAN7SXG4_9EURO|nr:hypothetical protein LTR05_005929 [Lithohypha guttulata]
MQTQEMILNSLSKIVKKRSIATSISAVDDNESTLRLNENVQESVDSLKLDGDHYNLSFDQYKSFVTDKKKKVYKTRIAHAQRDADEFFDHLKTFVKGVSDEHPALTSIEALNSDLRLDIYASYGKDFKPAKPKSASADKQKKSSTQAVSQHDTAKTSASKGGRAKGTARKRTRVPGSSSEEGEIEVDAPAEKPLKKRLRQVSFTADTVTPSSQFGSSDYERQHVTRSSTRVNDYSTSNSDDPVRGEDVVASEES